MAVDFSVLVPLFNGAAYITDALDSVAQQTCDSWECIVVDDGSRDDSAARVRQWAASRGRPLTVLTHANRGNRGVPASRNLAAQSARGRWLAFLDQDDRWAADKLSRQAAFLRANPDVPAVSCVPTLDTSVAAVPVHIRLWRQSIVAAVRPDGRIDFPRFVTGCPFYMSGAVVRRDVFMQMGGFSNDLPDTYDWLFWACLATRSALGLLPEELGTYRVRAGSMMDRLASEPLALVMAVFEVQERLAQWLAGERHWSLDDARQCVAAHADWAQAAAETGIQQAEWWHVLAGNSGGPQ